MKNEFLSVVSHELRTPLTSIRGSLGLLAGGQLGELPERAASLVGVAVQNSERLTRLINDLLDIERMDSGVAPDGASSLSTSASCWRRPPSRSRAWRPQWACGWRSGSAEGRVLADEDRIIQTLMNLLGNAIKFSEPGSVVRARRRPGRAGGPLPGERRRPRHPGRQAGEHLRPVRAGRLLRHPAGGRDRPRPDHQQGHRGAAGWPDLGGERARRRYDGPLHPAGSADRPGRWASEPTEPRSAPGPAPTVLVCDDDAAVVEEFSRLLRAHGYRPIGVTDGATVLEVARAERPRAVLLDLMMPGATGAQVLRGAARVAGHPRHPGGGDLRAGPGGRRVGRAVRRTAG